MMLPMKTVTVLVLMMTRGITPAGMHLSEDHEHRLPPCASFCSRPDPLSDDETEERVEQRVRRREEGFLSASVPTLRAERARSLLRRGGRGCQ